MAELGINNNPIDLHVVKWHSKLDALLGSEDLLKLGASNYKTNSLEIEHRKILFYFEYVLQEVNKHAVIKNNTLSIFINIENGDVILPELKSPNLTIPESIVRAKNGNYVIPIYDEVKVSEINFKEIIEVKPLESEILENPPTKTNLKISQLIRTNHLNEEESREIIKC